MQVCGFTFIRNAVKYDYPVVEAIQSVLPLCDKFIVVCGDSEDNTRNLISRIDPQKIIIHDSTWNPAAQKGGAVLAEETNKAIDLLPAYDWAFYIQADEVLHEKYHHETRETMHRWKDDQSVEGLLFNYLHFYGSYDYTGDSPRWYRNEVRIIRCDKTIRSYRDAQGFRKNGRPLNVKQVDASIFHYGWVKPPQKQQEKQRYFHSLWHDAEWIRRNVSSSKEFDYSSIDSVARYSGTHPEVMQERISKMNWTFSFDPSRKKLSFKSFIKRTVEKLTGWRIGEYKNYKKI